MTTDTINITVLVQDTTGEELLWLETDADGNTTLNDINTSVPFNPTEEPIGDAVERWMRAVGMQRYRFTVTWIVGDLLPEDWDAWCNSDDLRIDSNGAADGEEVVYVWGTDYEDARTYLEWCLVDGMSIEDEDEDE